MRIIALISIMWFGTCWSQTTFFISPLVKYQVSFNSSDPYDWNRKMMNGDEDFNYKYEHICARRPLYLGANLGFRLNDKNTFLFGISMDGSSEFTQSSFYSYSDFDSTFRNNSTRTTTKTAQTKYSLSYYRKIKTFENSSSLSLGLSLGYVVRCGSDQVENIGSFGTSNVRISENKYYSDANTSFTAGKSALTFGLSLQSQIYFQKKYWFDIDLNYNYSKKYLYMSETKVSIYDASTLETKKYSYFNYLYLTNVNLTLSRKINLTRKK
jgi:hypothetical protein